MAENCFSERQCGRFPDAGDSLLTVFIHNAQPRTHRVGTEVARNEQALGTQQQTDVPKAVPGRMDHPDAAVDVELFSIVQEPGCRECRDLVRIAADQQLKDDPI